MKHLLIILSVFILGLTVASCGGVEEEPIDEYPTIEGKADWPGPECTYTCSPCPPKAKRCNQVCYSVGNCNAKCDGYYEVCADGFVWSVIACRCLPDVAPH
jgi:hypothetical protein